MTPNRKLDESLRGTLPVAETEVAADECWQSTGFCAEAWPLLTEVSSSSPLVLAVYASPSLQDPLAGSLPPINSNRFELMRRLNDALPELALRFWQVLQAEPPESLLLSLPLNPPEQRWCVDVLWLDQAEMVAVNTQFRQKPEPTDVLSFPLLDAAGVHGPLLLLPELHLGSVLVSLDWVCQVAAESPATAGLESLHFENDLALLLALERVVHGWLHLLGVHHHTVPDYNRVVAIQRQVVYDGPKACYPQ
ncbi:MAG: rRNA maturation RNase YbeY [Candidatus Melainabacteria bacterium]|nr:rRNA maturation RNase YbeY [Candidatus Melainabacteria bacterium]